MFNNLFFGNSTYVLTSTGIKFKDREFFSKQQAEEYLFKFLGKKDLYIEEIYDDVDCKTYKCPYNIRFYISKK